MLTDEKARQYYAKPHLVGSAKEANEILAFMNADITDLRGQVEDLELDADLYLNKMVNEKDQGFEKTKAEWKTTDVYLKWRKEKGHLSDIRAWHRSFERHVEILINQEKYRPNNSSPHYGSII
jgi:hypothetical protein